MINDVKYLLDEHVNPRLKKAIKQFSFEITVWCVGDVGAPSLSTLDPEILTWCESNGFILVTNNRTSMPIHLRDHLLEDGNIPGIFIMNPKMSLGDTAEELFVIWGASMVDEYRNQIRYLPLSE